MLQLLSVLMAAPMEELHSLDPRRQELLEARFTGAVSGNTVGSTGSTSGGAKVTVTQKKRFPKRCQMFNKKRAPSNRVVTTVFL